MSRISCLPYFFRGRVVHGFQRGGKQLGCPTANMDDDVISALPSDIPCGVFYGMAKLENQDPAKMVMSIGWNPHYNNERKTVEVHILQKFDSDFYGSQMECVVLGFIRDMKKFSSLDELINAIRDDIDTAEKELSTSFDQKSICEQYFSTSRSSL